jgi:hypothetical protein
MLVNLPRLLGAVKNKMATRSRQIDTRPMQVVPPISRNDELHSKYLKRPSTSGLLKAGVSIYLVTAVVIGLTQLSLPGPLSKQVRKTELGKT